MQVVQMSLRFSDSLESLDNSKESGEEMEIVAMELEGISN